MRKPYAAIILAAGYSSRMGEFKPLLPFGGSTVIERVIGLFLDAGIDRVRVVTGHRSTELLPFMGGAGVRPVLNDRYQEGMFTSVLAGVKSLEEFRGAFFLLPVDIPLVRLQTIITLMAAYESGSKNILYPSFNGRRGHPPLISTEFSGRIASWKGEGGLNSFLAQYDSGAEEVEVTDKFILEDMDRPEEYRRLLEMREDLGLPTFQECEMLLLNRFAADKPLLDHCRNVARLALLLARELNKAGCSLDQELIAAASLLHDLAKGSVDHAAEGARIMTEIGYPSVAEIIAVHMDIGLPPDGPIGEGEVVYLADKMMQGDRFISLKERFAARMNRHAADPDACRAVAGRLKNALLIRDRLEKRLGRSLDEILPGNGFGSPDE
ncbi:MAG: DVU_1551 family NTP transferase [Deltaproteobacteria bacterium]